MRWAKLNKAQRRLLAKKMVSIRWALMTPEERSAYASKIAHIRWDNATSQERLELGKMLRAARRQHLERRLREQAGATNR